MEEGAPYCMANAVRGVGGVRATGGGISLGSIDVADVVDIPSSATMGAIIMGAAICAVDAGGPGVDDDDEVG